MQQPPHPPVYDADVVADAPPVRQTGIHLSLRYFPLAFVLAICTPVVVINGVAHRLPWGRHFVELPPGQ